jgi:ABC-type transport system substrate-binding protein
MEDPSSYNIDAVSDDFATMVMENVMSKLVKFDCAGNLLPDLAASWDVSEDGLTYTFHLQQNVLWHDGVPFTSGDVLWTFQKIAAEGSSGMLPGQRHQYGDPRRKHHRSDPFRPRRRSDLQSLLVWHVHRQAPV